MLRPLCLLYRRFSASSFYKSVAWVAGGTAIAQVISMVLAPVYTRLYTPESYGILAVISAVLGFLAPLANLTYATAIPLDKDEKVAENLLKLCMIITTLIGGLIAALVYFQPIYLIDKLSLRPAVPYLWFLPVCFVGAGWYNALSGWAIRRKHFKLIAGTRIYQVVLSSIVKLGFGICGIQIFGLLLALLTSSTAGNGRILRKVAKESPIFFFHFSLSEIALVAHRYIHFPIYRIWSRIVLALATRLPIVFIAALFDVKVVGYYAFAISMVNIPITLIVSAVAQVYYAEIASYGKEQPEKIYLLSISIIKKLLLISVIPFCILFFMAPILFSVVFGERWLMAGVYARYLSFMMVGRMICVPIMSCLNVFEKQGLQLFLNILQVIVVGAVLYFSKYCELSDVQTIMFFSLSKALLYCCTVVFVLRVIGVQI